MLSPEGFIQRLHLSWCITGLSYPPPHPQPNQSSASVVRWDLITKAFNFTVRDLSAEKQIQVEEGVAISPVTVGSWVDCCGKDPEEEHLRVTLELGRQV